MTRRGHEINGTLVLIAIVVCCVTMAAHEKTEQPRKFGPQAWETEFKRQ